MAVPIKGSTSSFFFGGWGCCCLQLRRTYKMVIVWILLIVGWVWYYLDRKNEKRNKTPMILLAVGNCMLAVYLFVFMLIGNPDTN